MLPHRTYSTLIIICFNIGIIFQRIIIPLLYHLNVSPVGVSVGAGVGGCVVVVVDDVEVGVVVVDDVKVGVVVGDADVVDPAVGGLGAEAGLDTASLRNEIRG